MKDSDRKLYLASSPTASFEGRMDRRCFCAPQASSASASARSGSPRAAARFGFISPAAAQAQDRSPRRIT